MKRSICFLILALLTAPAQAGAFKDACMDSAGSALAETTCTCQEKLAESTLNATELKAITASAAAKKADYVAAINEMTEEQATQFHNKMRALSDAVDAQCPAFAQ